MAVVPVVVVPMVVWIAWWACVDVLFHALFHTRQPMAVSDESQFVFHTQITTKHSAVQLVPHLSTLHLANQQEHHVFLHAKHTSPSRSFHNCPSFPLLNVVSFIAVVLVIIESVSGCDGMHHSFTLIINTVCVSLWCHPVLSSLCFDALAVVHVVHHTIVLHTHTTF